VLSLRQSARGLITLDTLLYSALSTTHLLWAGSLLLEPWRYVGKPIIPALFAFVHIIAALAILGRYRTYGGWLSVTILSYYWMFIKPREPIAEPQSVGILAISAVLLMPHVQRLVKNRFPPDINLLAIRLGIAYPFLEWGLDALRNPIHFRFYFQGNPLTQFIIAAWNPATVILLLASFEVGIAFLHVLGLVSRVASLGALIALIVFSSVAGYPLALPQDIALGAAAAYLMKKGPGIFSMDHVFRRIVNSSF